MSDRIYAKSKLDAFFISECDAVSWLLNLRSDCLPDTPIIRAFALVDKSGEVSLFTNDFKK
ncbi:MAG: aminopeptidase P family N-terminal domain-containing protein [Alphaproteobacteria bacterium]